MPRIQQQIVPDTWVTLSTLRGSDAVEGMFGGSRYAVIHVSGQPAAEIGPWGGHPLPLPKRLQQSVLIEVEEHLMVLLKLRPEWAVQELHGRIRENRNLGLNVVNHRYLKKRPMIFTTNKPLRA